MRFLTIGYHDHQGVVLDTAEQASLIADPGDAEAVIFRNHGALVVGRSVGEAFNWMHRLELACRVQIGAMSCNMPLRGVPPQVLGHLEQLPTRHAPALWFDGVACAAAREGADPVGGAPAQFGQFMQQEYEKWTLIVRESGATVD